MFKQGALEDLQGSSQAPTVSSWLSRMSAIREALLFKRSIGELCTSVDSFAQRLLEEGSSSAAIYFWRNVVTTKLKSLSSESWQYIDSQFQIVEHAGVSTYLLVWATQFEGRFGSITAQLDQMKDSLDAEEIATSAREFCDLLTTTSYSVDVYLLDYVSVCAGKIPPWTTRSDALALEDRP